MHGLLTNLSVVLRSYDDSKLFGESYGEGDVQVVWLHGWARRGADFARAGSQLAEHGVASVALDLPGFGASPAPLIPGDAHYYRELLAPTLRALSAGPLVIVGHSFGGRVATVLAASEPDVIRGLVLTGVPLVRETSPQQSPWRYRLTRRLYARHLVSEERMEQARQRYGSFDYRQARGVVRDVLVATVNESYDEDLARVEAPVYFVWGELDHVVPVDIARRARALVRAPSTVRVVEGVGHLLPLEAPEVLVEVVLEALGS